MRLPWRVGRPARGLGPGSGPWGRVQSSGASCPFRLAPVHHPATSQPWQPGNPTLTTGPRRGLCLPWARLGLMSHGDRLWGHQLSLVAVLASASPEETPPGTPALIPMLSCPLPHHLLQPGGHSPA